MAFNLKKLLGLKIKDFACSHQKVQKESISKIYFVYMYKQLLLKLHLHLVCNEKTFHWYLRILISQENYFIYVVADSL